MQPRSTHFFALLLALALIAPPAAIIRAQDATPEATPAATETPITNLSYNTPVTGLIDNTTPIQTWPLQTASADRITLRVERADGNLIPSVALLDASGGTINGSGPDPTGAAAAMGNITLPTAGQFQVQVSRKDGPNGVTTGHYTLTILVHAVAADSASNAAVIGPLKAETPVDGKLTNLHWLQRYTYTAAATDSVNLTVQRTGGNLLPQLYILDANGASLATGYNGNTGDFASVGGFTFPSAGDYMIVVSRKDDFGGDSVGKYTLTLNLIGAGAGNPSLKGPTGAIEYDQPLTGEISGPQWYQDWTLKTTAGDTLSAVVTRTDGNLKPYLLLLGGGGQELMRGYASNTQDSAGFYNQTLQTPGTYTLRVVRDGDQNGLTSGKYTLTVYLVGAGQNSPTLAGATGAVTLGTPVKGEVTNARWADSWTIEGNGGDKVHIAVLRTSGTLIPHIDIRDINGQTLNSAYPGASGDTSAIDYTFPATGTFQIVVFRDGNQGGLTAGGYELTVTKPE